MTRSHIAVGGLDITAESFQQIISRLDWDMSFLEELDGASPYENAPSCVVVDWEAPDTRDLCVALRGKGILPDVPMIAVVDDPWSSVVADAFAAGADDYLARDDLSRLEQKVVALAKGGAIVGQSASGRVVLVDPDRDERVLLARQLHRMGFDVQFALEIGDIPTGDDAKMLVISAALDVAEALARREGDTPCLLVGSREQTADLDLDGLDGVKVFDTAADPAQIVFVANQLLTAEFTQLRSSKRLVYGVPIAFGGLGTASGRGETFGFTYNVSLGGLFVRTLTPPAMGTLLDLSFTPPAGRGRVLVSGRVVWRQEQPVGRNGVPCGFGLQYTDIAVADGAALDAGYAELARELEVSV